MGHRSTFPVFLLCGALACGLAGCAAELGFVTASAPQELDCQRSKEAVEASAKRMAGLVPTIKAQSEAMPNTLSAVFGRMTGKPGDGLQAYTDYERERQRAEPILANAKAKGCDVAEGEKQLEDAKAKMADLRR